ncbi:MAG: hypothetical protein D6768_00965 [Chloroflexi bacterium]|nr:MAG: hypothetical protein D6768_00965 [Chloroflexota bacterium]
MIPTHKIDSNGQSTPIEVVPESGSIDLQVGEGLHFRTGVITDRNNNPVPDGTLVDFFRYYPLEGLSLEPLQAETTDGIAEIVIIKERDTPLQVRASSNLAVESVTFNIGPGIVDTPTPTPTLTPTITPTPSATASPTPSPTPVPTFSPTPQATATPFISAAATPPLPDNPVIMMDLVYSILGSLLIAVIAFTLGGDWFPLEERVRSALVPVATGLVGYIFYTIVARAFPSAEYVQILIQQNATGHWVAPLFSILFAVVGVIVWHLKPGRLFWKQS